MDESTAPIPAAPLASTEQPILVWEAKEFNEYSRSQRWHAIVSAIGAVLVIGALVFAGLSDSLRDIMSNVLVALVFGLALYVVLKHADDPPKELTYSISKLGINVGDTFYPYNELKLFWIIYKPPVKTLTFQTVNRFKPLIKVNLGEVDPIAVRTTLREYLPEDTKREEDMLDKFSRFIRL